MARFEADALALALVGEDPPACPVGESAGCVAIRRDDQRLYERWERAIARLQGALACSHRCPLADHFLKTVHDLSSTANPLAEACPELDPAPRRRVAAYRRP